MITFNKEHIYIVTGASSGIGQSVAHTLNELGATVVAIARREDRLLETQKKSQHPENFHIEVKDLVEDIEGLPKYVTSLKKKYGKFSGLAFCAGISEHMSTRGLYLEDMKHAFDINYFAPFFMIKGLVDKRNNIGKGTAILAIASISAHLSLPGMAVNSGNKAALIASLRVIAKEVAEQGIRINTVSPSLIKTDMADDVSMAYGEGKYPFGFGEVSDVANFTAFLLSEKSKWINGRDYIIDCGSM